MISYEALFVAHEVLKLTVSLVNLTFLPSSLESFSSVAVILKVLPIKSLPVL